MHNRITKVCLVLFIMIPMQNLVGQPNKVNLSDHFIDPAHVVVKGELGKAITTSEQGRLRTLPSWNDSALIKMFTDEARNRSTKQDWYGEHAGKWLYSTALAVERTNDKYLKQLLFSTADYLIDNQEPNGYLGSYSPSLRITNKNNELKGRSWDVWSLSYMTLGLLKLNEYFPNQKYLSAAKKIGELFLQTFGDGVANVTDYGTRDGISATIILDPVIELYKVTNDIRYLNFAKLVLKETEEKQNVRFISVGLKNGDMENIGDGKAYQIIWNLTALTKLYEVTGDVNILTAIENCWQNIVENHLTITGGPWGGIGKHYECFNRKGFWSPYGFIETCSTMSWIQFNKELLRVTGEAKYAQEIEKSAYNALLGAQFPNGEDWSYHTFSNGRRHVAHFNDCCPSSGALALEELTSVIYSLKGNGIAINLYTESEATIPIKGSGAVHLKQKTEYPFNGNIILNIDPKMNSRFPIFIRIPDWVGKASISINGKDIINKDLIGGTYFKIEREWRKDDKINIVFPFDLKIHKKSENAKVPQGRSDIYNVDWYAFSEGPLIYSSSGLIAGVNREAVYPLSMNNVSEMFTKINAPEGVKGNAYQLNDGNLSPILLVPYFEAGGRHRGGWRLTWIQKKIDD